jgi:hypothetical protein
MLTGGAAAAAGLPLSDEEERDGGGRRVMEADGESKTLFLTWGCKAKEQ